MIFNKHSAFEGSHAFLSASQSAWVNYTDEQLEAVYKSSRAAVHGTRLHNFASESIELGIKLPDTRQTMNMYVNDAIGYRMISEQMLFYSEYVFGTADAISFRDKKLRIHDLKTGVRPCSMRQLEVYAALFCLEYKEKPGLIDIELRIYQNDDVVIHTPETENIAHIIDKIISFDNKIKLMRLEELS